MAMVTITDSETGVTVEAANMRSARRAARAAAKRKEQDIRERAKAYDRAQQNMAAEVGMLLLYPARAEQLFLADIDADGVHYDATSGWSCILPGGARAELGTCQARPRTVQSPAGILYAYCGPKDNRGLLVFGEAAGVVAWAEIFPDNPVYGMIPREM